MLVESNIFYVLMVADWKPHEVSPFQGFAPGILDQIPTLQSLVRFPGDVFEYSMPPEDRLARRIGGVGGWRWIPFNASSLPELSIPLTMPIWVMFSTDPNVAAAVEVWRQSQSVRPLHVGLNGVNADHQLDELTVDVLAQHCRQALAACKVRDPDLEVADCLDAVNRWLPPAQKPSPLTFASHNVSVPNEMVLLSEGYMRSTGRPVEGEADDTNYVSAVEESALQVIALRNVAGEPLAFRADPPRPRVILFAPAMYRGLNETLSAVRAAAPAGLIEAIRLMHRQRTFTLQTANIDLFSLEAFKGAIGLRSRELKVQAAAIGLLGASTVAATVRLPPSVNRTAGAVAHLSTHLRNGERVRPVKTARVFKAVQNALSASVSSGQFEVLRSSQSGIKIVSDAPLEWLPLDGLPLGLRRDVSRINATPGALTFGELSRPSTLYLDPDSFLNFLVVSSFALDDPIRDHLQLALSALTETAGVRFSGQFVQVSSKDEMITALNSFDGPMAIFDMHGQHEDHIGALNVGSEKIDVWGLRGTMKVPPIVALSACDTHPADRSHATVANGFIHCGARAVLATLLPVRSASAASLIARLLLRAVVYTRAKIRGGNAVPWSHVVGGMLRMHMVNEAVRAMAAGGLINPSNVPALQTTGNEAILRGDSDWFERFQSNLSAAAGFDAEQWQRFFDDFLAASDAIRYVHIGNPETIIVTSQELIEQVHRRADASRMRAY